MKKTLVILLALVLVFAFASTAMAEDVQYKVFGDVTGQTPEIQTAVERLAIFGAIKGYDESGTTYGGERNITREEYATILVRVAGLEDQLALYAAMPSAFSDIEENRWSKGYINLANANKLMIGRGYGIFDPKANVTMQEVVTGALRMVGYTDALPGTWPQKYNEKAVAVGMAKYVDFVGPRAATRYEVASLINESLDLFVVYYLENDTARAIGQSMGFISNFYGGFAAYDSGSSYSDSGTNYVDKDGFAYKTFQTNAKKIYRSTVAFENYGAYNTDYAIFQDDKDMFYYEGDTDMEEGLYHYGINAAFSESTGWGFTDFADWELEAYTMGYHDIASPADGADMSEVMEFASVYGISGNQDITDLGGQIGDITLVDGEIVYIELVSNVERIAEVAKDIEDSIFANTLEKDGYGETWTAKKNLTVILREGNGATESYKLTAKTPYFIKDFDTFQEAPFGIVDSANDKGVNFKVTDSSYYSGFTTKITTNDTKQDEAFYLMGTGFVKSADLKAGDVVYKDNFWEYSSIYDDDLDYLFSQDDEVDFYLVFRPTTGTLDAISDESVDISDNTYGAQVDGTGNNSFYSADIGDTFYAYDSDDVMDINWSENISWVPAYAFNNFAYFTDEIAIYNYGILDHYEITGSATRVDGSGAGVITGVYILMPDDEAGEPSYFKLADSIALADVQGDWEEFFDPAYVDGTLLQGDAGYPIEGSLVEFVINDKGEFDDWRWGLTTVSFDNGTDNIFFEAALGHSFDFIAACTGNDDHGDAEGTWGSSGRLAIDYVGSGMHDDTYTFAANAKIFMLESNASGDYDFGTAKCLDYEGFKKLGDFTAADLCVYKATSSGQIQVLYVLDSDAIGEAAFAFGVFSGKIDKKVSQYRAEINGIMVPISSDVRTALNNYGAGLIAYRTSDGEINNVGFIYLMDGVDYYNYASDPTDAIPYQDITDFNTWTAAGDGWFKNFDDLTIDDGYFEDYTGGDEISFYSEMSNTEFFVYLDGEGDDAFYALDTDTGKAFDFGDIINAVAGDDWWAEATIAYTGPSSNASLAYAIIWEWDND